MTVIHKSYPLCGIVIHRTVEKFLKKEVKIIDIYIKEWYNKKMRQCWFKYTKPELMKCSFYTWNVCERNPKEISIEEFLENINQNVLKCFSKIK